MILYCIIVSASISFGFGFILGLDYHNGWDKWKDIGIVFDSTEYQWNLLQVKIKKDGTKKFRTIKVTKYNDLTKEQLEQIDKQLTK